MFVFVTLLIVIYCILILYLRLSDTGNGKKKDIAGWLLFGLMWPQIRQQIEKDHKHREKVFISILIIFMIVAVGVTYLITNGNFFLELVG